MAEGDVSGMHAPTAVEGASAGWYAHRAPTPDSGHSSSICTQDSPRDPESPSISASAPAASPAPPPSTSIHPAATLESDESATSTSSLEGDESQAPRDVSMISGDTAWEAALKSLPEEFANASVPLHPLAQALIEQPALRSVEWNQFRVAGSFVPRTAHDFSSLMIYLSGQVSPNPCRNCLLRNGPFAHCVVSPPIVLANSTLRHACANCTYQNQYKKCTNEPISEQEKVRAELQRSMMRTKNPVPRPPMARKPKSDGPPRSVQATQSDRQYELEFQRRYWAKDRQRKRKREERGDKSTNQSPAGLGAALGSNPQSFDEKLRQIRACSPRTRRRFAAETLQWQAAIATVDAEEATAVTNASMASPLPAATPVHHHHYIPAPPNSYTPSQFVPPSSAPAAVRGFAVDTPIRTGSASYGAGHMYEATRDDRSEDEQDSYEGTPWVGPSHIGSTIKPAR
ncbi:hypothetical protein F5Y07DRAFT_349099 [Xylaria sp. FL0933]|nr:hypothetical protein F5Y07DRAFT_349099 [Xylaria sp. FL0933]